MAVNPPTSKPSVDYTGLARSISVDICGIALVGAAVYGLVSGKVATQDFSAITTAAAFYLGVRIPTGN